MKKQIDAILYGSATLLAVSVFLPLTRFAVIGDVSYNRIAALESYIVVALALSAAAFLYLKQPKLIIVSVVGVWLTLLFPALKGLLKGTDNSLLGQLSSKANQVMQDFAADLFLNIFEFSWGGYVFILALVSFTVTGFIRFTKK